MSDWTQEHYVLELEAEIERLTEQLEFAKDMQSRAEKAYTSACAETTRAALEQIAKLAAESRALPSLLLLSGVIGKMEAAAREALKGGMDE